MVMKIVVPEIGESISEATVANWLKESGEAVSEGETLVELETDKVMVEVPAPQAGVLENIEKQAGETVQVGQVLGTLNPEGVASSKTTKKSSAPAATEIESTTPAKIGPAARKLAEEHHLNPASITPTGPHQIITKDDVVRNASTTNASTTNASTTAANGRTALSTPSSAATVPASSGTRQKRVKMTRLRQRIAERLLQAQHQSAMLTTFNEVDMNHVIALRTRYKEMFEKKYGSRLGFMSFFTKASVQALKDLPAVNAEIDGDEIIYKHYYDIGVAVSTERGLVVPVIRNADRLRYIEIEQEIARLAGLAKQNKLTVQDLSGGTFTITNGGVYGSMLSTPILNPPQAGILGMHNIVQRPMVVNDQIVARPMMYLALSYDHRLIDGKEAVQFLVKIKQFIEDPSRLLLEI